MLDDVIKWKHFRVTGPLWGEFTGHRWIPSLRPMTRIFVVFFDLRLNKRLSKQLRCRWFETPWRSLWCHRNGTICIYHTVHSPSYTIFDCLCLLYQQRLPNPEAHQGQINKYAKPCSFRNSWFITRRHNIAHRGWGIVQNYGNVISS